MRKEYDRTNLPKWAQNEISRLERDLAYERDKLAQGPENSNTFAEPYATTPRPLGENPNIEFRLGDKWGDKINVRIEGDKLQILGGSRITIFPESSNTFSVGVAE